MATLLQFNFPPMPHYIISGFHVRPPGRKHPSRKNIGVFDLLAVTSGSLHIGEENRRYEVTPGHALILRPDCRHYPTRKSTEETRYYWLHFTTNGSWSTADTSASAAAIDNESAGLENNKFYTAQTFTASIPQYIRLVQPHHSLELLEQLVQLEQNTHMDGVRWKQQTLFQELLLQLSASVEADLPSSAKSCAEKAASYIRRHYRGQITAQTLGDSLNFHPVYIARCMQKVYGCSPFEYLLQFRIEQSKLLLLQTDLPISRIADEVGFNHAAYFTKTFTKLEGMTPRKFRTVFTS